MPNQAKQTLGQPQQTLGKTAAPDTIWQADLAEFFHDTDNPDAKFVLVVVNLTDRKLYTRPMLNKKPNTVRYVMVWHGNCHDFSHVYGSCREHCQTNSHVVSRSLT